MTDHAATAIASLGLWSRLPAPATDPEEEARQWLSEAQVHATLALVDEQHTANQIAFFEFLGEPETSAQSIWRDSVMADIAARLGLTPTTPNQEQ